MKKTNITTKQAQKIISYYLAPHSLNETSIKFQLSRSAVSTILKHNNINKHSREIVLKLNKLNTEKGYKKHFGNNYKEKLHKMWSQDRIIFSKEEVDAIINYYNSPQSIRNTAKHFGFNKNVITRLLKKHNIPLHDQSINAKLLRQNCRSKEAIIKSKNTCLQKYGVEYSFQSVNNKEKSKNTCLKKYGTTSYAKTTAFLQKVKQTCLQRYGETSYSKTPTFKAQIGSNLDLILTKSKKTCLQRYSVENFTQTEQFKVFMQDFMQSHYKDIVIKTKQTCLIIYGTEYYLTSEDFKRKLPIIQEALATRRADIQKKANNTKRKNGTFNTSSPEKRFYEYLLTKYPKEDIFQQYTDPRYPFICDFYIKSKDLFIELNLHWTHGGKPFNKATDYIKLATWNEKAKTSKFYQNAIKTWTVRDVTKLSYFKQNKLNYKIFYSVEELPF